MIKINRNNLISSNSLKLEKLGLTISFPLVAQLRQY
jgi:hypothetical protein